MPRVLLTLSLFALTTFAQTSAVNQFASAPTNHATEKDCGCELKLPADVLAIVNGIRISTAEVDAPLQVQLTALRQQVIAARQRELDLQINSRLLDAEAKRRGIPAQKLIDEVVLAQVKAPTAAEAQAFYEQNKASIQGEFAAVKDDLLAYLLSQRQRAEAGKYAAQLRAAAQVQIHVKEVTPPQTFAERKRVLATVNNQPITADDVEASLQPFIARVQEEMYQLRQNELALRINDTLLQQEAQKQKLTPTALLSAALKAHVASVTESDARQFYEQNKERVSGEFAQVKDQIIQYLQRRAERKVEESLAARLRQSATVQVFLLAPEVPALNIATDDQPTKGNAAAAVTIVEFTDFQCPSCAQAQPVIEQALKDYAGKVKLVVRDFPLEKHPDAFKAAEAAEAARAQGKYWEYSALLFQNQAALSSENLKAYAAQLKLNAQQFNAALEAGTFADQVRRDYQDGLQLGVSGTPTLFVNGRLVAEPSYAALKAAIEAALKEIRNPKP
ncbi:MAG TPA: thioredoxin domain-containing protein [Blastocatellia bacterium]|nr:thioredoxin domain-containing protein [Blastocatellia bacterium]